jgi:hypothetical protein
MDQLRRLPGGIEAAILQRNLKAKNSKSARVQRKKIPAAALSENQTIFVQARCNAVANPQALA